MHSTLVARQLGLQTLQQPTSSWACAGRTACLYQMKACAAGMYTDIGVASGTAGPVLAGPLFGP